MRKHSANTFGLSWLRWFHWNELILVWHFPVIKCWCEWALRMSQAFRYQLQKNNVCCTNQHRHPIRNGQTLCFDQKLQWQLCGINSPRTVLQREREVNGASLSVCSDPFHQDPHVSPSSVGGRQQVGPQSFTLLFPLCNHFQSVTLGGWRSVSPFSTDRAPRRGHALQFSCQFPSFTGRLPHCSLGPCRDGGLPPEEESHYWDFSPGGAHVVLFPVLHCQ